MIEPMRTVGRELRSFPDRKELCLCALATWVLAGLAWLVLPDFANLDDIPSLTQMLKIAVVAFFFPAFFEEFLFRGLLNPTQTFLSISVSTILFVLWHPVAAYFFVPRALPMMLDVRFLVFVTIFGISFCLMRRWTGSLWAPILCHWLLTVTWKGLGGAQFLTE